MSGMREHQAQLRPIWRRGKIVIVFGEFKYVYEATGRTTIDGGYTWAEFAWVDPEQNTQVKG